MTAVARPAQNLAALVAVATTLSASTDAGARQQGVKDLKAAASTLPAADRATLQSTLQRLFPDVFVVGPSPKQPAPSSLSAGFGGVGQAVGRQFSVATAGKDTAAGVQKELAPLLSSTPPPAPLEQLFPTRGSQTRAAERAALSQDLQGVMVRGRDGAPTTLLHKLQGHPGLSPTQQARLIDVVSAVKAGYARAADLVKAPPGYQDVNWKHTRLELDRVLDVALAHGLSPQDTESAILASAFSDSVKAPSNFIAHNVHGAQAALHVLSSTTPPLSGEQLTDIGRAILEHQVGPPGFMGQVAMRGLLKGHGVDAAVVDRIASKIASPFASSKDGQIVFDAAEQAALAKVGVPAWTVPGSGRHAAIARAVIDADSLVNYACPDGWAKLAALHGPDQPVFLQEPLLEHALTSLLPGHASARRSFDGAKSVVSAASMPLYEAGLQRTEAAVGDVGQALQQWVEALPAGEVPRRDGGVPYLTAPLDYGDAEAVAFARRLRDHAVTLLRAKEQP